MRVSIHERGWLFWHMLVLRYKLQIPMAVQAQQKHEDCNCTAIQIDPFHACEIMSVSSVSQQACQLDTIHKVQIQSVGIGSCKRYRVNIVHKLSTAQTGFTAQS